MQVFLLQLEAMPRPQALQLEVMPQREFATPDELLEALDGLDTILIDVTERNYRRPQDDQEQEEHYSGKKKDTLLKTR